MSATLGYFHLEASERLERLQSLLAACRSDGGDRERLDDLFRQAHSLKGAAGVAGATEVAEVCHGMEDVLGRVRNGEIELNAALVDELTANADRIGALVSTANGGPESPTDPADRAASACAPATMIEDSIPRGSDELPDARPSGVASGAPESRAAIGNDTVRVHLATLDEIRDCTGELIVAGERLDQRLSSALELRRLLRRCHLVHSVNGDEDPELQRIVEVVEHLVEALANDSALLGPLFHDIHRQAMNACMLPVGHLFEPFQRFVREQCQVSGRKAALRIEGGEIRIDRRIMETLNAALVHLLRNAFASR